LVKKIEFDREKETFEEKLETCDSELCNLQSEYQSMLSIKSELQQEFDEQTHLYEDLKNKFSGLESEHGRRLKDIENIQIQLDNSESKLKDNISDINESDSVIRKLKDDCETLEKVNEELKSKLDANSLELSEKAKSVIQLEETNAKCNLEISKLKNQIADLDSNRLNVEGSQASLNESHGAKINELENIIAEKDVEISRLKKDINELEDENKNSRPIDDLSGATELQTAIDMKETQIQELNAFLDETKEECQTLKAQKERITKETEIEINACMNTIAGNEETINNLKIELKT